MTEEQLQQKCYLWLNNTHGLKNSNPKIIMFSIPNETAMLMRSVMMQFRIPKNIIDKITAIVIQRFKNTGLKAGVSDTIIVFPNNTVYAEFKTLTGTQTARQKEFQKDIESLGHEYVIIRTFEQFQEYVNNRIQNG